MASEAPAALDASPPATVPVGWETEAEWDLETRMFHAGRDGVPADVRTVIRDLWHQYCLAADPNGPVQGPLRAEIAALKATHQRTLEALGEAKKALELIRDGWPRTAPARAADDALARIKEAT